jgi:hypothetical protein
MYRGVINDNAAFLHYFFNVTKTQRVCHVPSHTKHHDFQRIMQSFKNLAEGTFDEAFAKIVHTKLYQIRLLRLNSDQEARVDEMIWPVADIISYISRFVTLAPGDLIFGTPAGVGALLSGDHVRGGVDGLATFERYRPSPSFAISVHFQSSRHAAAKNLGLSWRTW